MTNRFTKKLVQRAIFLTGFFLLGIYAYSQGQQRTPYFNISYFGILGTHPGLKVGVQYPIATLNQDRLDERLNQLLGAASVIFYYHRRNQIALGVDVELGFRNREAAGLNKAIFLGMGYLRTWLPNKVYDFDGTGPPDKRFGKGVNRLLKTASIGIGKQFDQRIDGRFWMFKPTLMQVKPFNFASTINFALDAGIYFK